MPEDPRVQRPAEPATELLAQAILDGRVTITGTDAPDSHGVHTWKITITVTPAAP